MLPRPPTLARGPVTLVGYPKTVATGSNDPAQWVGFTSDGAEYGYCAELGARNPRVTECQTILRDGSRRTRSSDGANHDFSPAGDTSGWGTWCPVGLGSG